MTSTVIVEAHCSPEKEVKVLILTDADGKLERHTLEDGEKAEYYVYDDRSVIVKEVVKEK